MIDGSWPKICRSSPIPSGGADDQANNRDVPLSGGDTPLKHAA